MAPSVSLVAFGPVRDVAVMVIIGVATLTVDGTAAATIGRAPSFKVLRLQEATVPSSATTASPVARVV